MMTFESTNPVFGTTTNPYSPHHTSGGSSGGEGAIIGCDGAVAGVGSDIAGSLRIPSHHSGIYTVKPSPGRWSYNGQVDFGKGFESIHPVVGPMCRSAADLETFFVEVARQHVPKWLRTPKDKNDPTVLAEAVENDEEMAKLDLSDAPLNIINEAWLNPLGMAEARGTPLRIGYVVGDGIHRTTPACYRAIRECVTAVQTKYSTKQIELVEIEPSKLRIAEVMRIFLRLLTADGLRSLLKELGQDKIIPHIKMPILVSRLPRWIRSVIVFFIRYIVRDNLYADLAASMGQMSATEHAAVLERRHRFVDKWNHTMWHDLALDALIAPTQASPAVPHGGAITPRRWLGPRCCTIIVDASVALLPVLRVDPARDSHKEKDYTNATPEQKANHDRWASELCWKETSKLCNFFLYSTVYDAKKMEGLPVGVQVVTRPYHEEKAIGIMRLVDDALPSPASRGSAWKNILDARGSSISADKARSAVGFGPGA